MPTRKPEKPEPGERLLNTHMARKLPLFRRPLLFGLSLLGRRLAEPFRRSAGASAAAERYWGELSGYW